MDVVSVVRHDPVVHRYQIVDGGDWYEDVFVPTVVTYSDGLVITVNDGADLSDEDLADARDWESGQVGHQASPVGGRRGHHF